MDTDIENWLAEQSYSQQTIDKYRRVLRRLVGDLGGDLAGLSAGGLRSWLRRQSWGSAMQYMAGNACKGFLRWKYGGAHAALTLRVKRLSSPPQRSLNMQQVQLLLGWFDQSTPGGIRDLALCSLALDSGLRAAELCRLDLRYLDLAGRRLQVLCKGSKWAVGVYSQASALRLGHWLAIRDRFNGATFGPVFVSVGGRRPGSGLTRGGLGRIVRSWGVRAGLGDLSPHDLRRTFANIATQRGAPARVLQVAGRWSSLEMVEHYTQAIRAEDFERYFPAG